MAMGHHNLLKQVQDRYSLCLTLFVAEKDDALEFMGGMPPKNATCDTPPHRLIISVEPLLANKLDYYCCRRRVAAVQGEQ